jgi:amylosucrase
MFLAHAVVAGWGGIPVIWSGDELAQPNDPSWADDPRHADDNRWAHRPRLDEAKAAGRHDLSTVEGKVYAGLAHLARVRAALPQLHASARVHVLTDTDPGILAVARSHAVGPMVGLYNVTGEHRPFPIHRLHEAGLEAPYEALGGHQVTSGTGGVVWLPPYAAWWVVEASLK